MKNFHLYWIVQSIRLFRMVKLNIMQELITNTPEGLVISREGEILTDSKQIIKDIRSEKAALAPLGGFGEDMGGYKGYGYATVVRKF